MSKRKRSFRGSSLDTRELMYKFLYIFYFIGKIPYSLPSVLMAIGIFLMNVFMLFICSIASVILLTGVIIVLATRYFFKSIRYVFKSIYSYIKKIIVYSGRTAYKYKLPIFTPIIFFTILYIVMTFIGNVKSEEKKAYELPEHIRIYDSNDTVLYNGNFKNVEKARYVRSREFVQDIINMLKSNPEYNIANRTGITVYTSYNAQTNTYIPDRNVITHIYNENGSLVFGSRFELFFNK